MKMKNELLATSILAVMSGVTMEGPKLPFTFVNMGDPTESSVNARVNIYDTIGSNFWEEGITAKAFIEQLSMIDDSADIDCHISTNGGCTKEGTVMYNALVNRQGKTNVVVDGYAMSMGSVLAMAGKNSGGTTKMVDNGFLFLHKPISSAYGNASDMRAMASTLDQIETALTKPYTEASGKTEEEISALLTANTWLDAAQALEMGFIDEILGSEATVEASFDKSLISDDIYGTVPEGFLAQFVAEEDTDESDEEDEEEEDSETKGGAKKKVKAESDEEDEAQMSASQLVALERTRCKDIQNMCDENGFASKASMFIDKGFSLADASDFIMELKASVEEEIVNRNGAAPTNNAQSGDWAAAYQSAIR